VRGDATRVSNAIEPCGQATRDRDQRTDVGPFLIGFLVGVGCRMMVFGARLGTLSGHTPADANVWGVADVPPCVCVDCDAY
jgi:hypothetical protein